jgi:hypothetical protein
MSSQINCLATGKYTLTRSAKATKRRSLPGVKRVERHIDEDHQSVNQKT